MVAARRSVMPIIVGILCLLIIPDVSIYGTSGVALGLATGVACGLLVGNGEEVVVVTISGI